MNKLGNGVNKSERFPVTPKLVSVLSGKGGVGKSVIALNLAERTAHLGYRTLLVDADLSFGNLHILANVDPADGLDAFAREQKNLSDATVRINDNLALLARSESGPVDELASTQALAALAAKLRSETNRYDLVVIDHGSGITTSATVFANASDINLLILAPELTSIADCYGLCKYLYQSNRAIDCRLLFNRIASDSEAEYVWTRFRAMAEQFLGQTPGLAGALPEDASVRQSVAAQSPISAVAPDSPLLRAMESVISNLGWTVSSPAASTQTREINIVTASADIRK
ncbi:MAG: AAA family ATPase [candidate division Zixibacteria bacterium]|nr:AAA family ATPase [candidate division Zixibacteria bacterium]